MDHFTAEAVAARKKVLENPFNACHGMYEACPPWVSFPTSALRSELKRRGLPHGGRKAELIERIKHQNELILTPIGRLHVYRTKLDFHNQVLADVVSFDLFPKLPPEIRLMIWQSSFRPRILTPARYKDRSVDMLHFLEQENHYNPATLSVCRESRAATLKHYRLCFGTTNIYADLSRDILYFGHSWWNDFQGEYSVFKWRKFNAFSGTYFDAEYSDDVKADLQQITHVALPPKVWRAYGFPRTGAILRVDFGLFPGMKELSLVTQHKPDHYGIPGYVELTDDTTHPWEAKIRTEFLTMNLTDEEKNGAPDARVVFAATISHVPHEDWLRDHGEPFYPPELAGPPKRGSSRLRNNP